MKSIMSSIRLVIVGLSVMVLSTNAVSSSAEERAAKLAKLGSIAAGFAEVSNGTATEALVMEKFAGFEADVIAAVKLWSKDPELEGAPPAFRRFLLFDYLTRGTDVIAAASNPPELLINADASVDIVFSDHPDIVSWASSQMSAVVDTPKTTAIGDYVVGVFPMMPNEAKAAGCVACHASAEVGRPYPAGQKVLGYTFVAIPAK